MTPFLLELTNYRSFRGTHRIDLNTGASAIVGVNGSGKSTVIGAPDFALFGPQSRSVEPYVAEGTDEMSVTLAFDHAGIIYRVRRSWTRGRSALDFERLAGDQWVSESQGNAADTQSRIESTIGMTRTTFRASGYLAQRQSDSFTGAQPRDRKRILSDALALDAWQTDADKVGADRRETQKQADDAAYRALGLAERAANADSLASEAGDLRLSIALAETGAAEAREAADAHAKRAADLEQQQTAWTLAKAAVDTAAARDTAHREKLDRTLAAKRDLDTAQQELAAVGVYVPADELEQEASMVASGHEAYRVAKQQRHAALETQNELGRRAVETEREATAIRAKAQQTIDLIGHSQHCETCGQTLGEEAARTAYAAFLARAAELEATATALADQARSVDVPELGDEPDVSVLDDLRRRIQDARGYAARELEIRTRIEGLERIVAETDTDEYRENARRLSFELAEAEQAFAAIAQPDPDAAAEALRLAGQNSVLASGHEAQVRLASERLAVVSALLEQAQAALVEHATAVAERDRLADELDVLLKLEQAFGRDGIPAWIVESQALPQIESEANRILRRLGGAISRVELRTERETKSGEKRDALDVICLTDDGERALETFSGGEQSRAEIALALGLVDVLQSRRDADLRYLALDEPSGLDTQGTAALAEILVERAAGSVVLLASHDPGLRDSFDQSVLVERGPGGSKVLL